MKTIIVTIFALAAGFSAHAMCSGALRAGEPILLKAQYTGDMEYVETVAYETLGYIVGLKGGGEVLKSQTARSVRELNGFERGQTVRVLTTIYYTDSQDAKILALFENGQAQVEFTHNGYYARGYKTLVSTDRFDR